MKKVTLLAASIAVALTGCGDSGGSDDTPISQISISAFDGYFKNAIMFVDTNDNGTWDVSEDEFIGLTQSKGEVKMAEKPRGMIAIQTLIPGGTAQAKLISINADKYAGVYTVDMDFPSQPMEYELVFRALSTSNVISPITDLAISYIDKGLTEEDLATDLGLESTDDLYTDFVAGEDQNTDLHKTAQLLTETKGIGIDINDDPQKFVVDAVENVGNMTQPQKEDPSYKAPIDGDISTLDDINYHTYINDAVFDMIEAGINELELAHGYIAPKPVTLLKVSVKDLFKDSDVPDGIESSNITLNTDNDYQILAGDGKTPSGIIAYISGDYLNIGLNSTDVISQVGALQLKVTLTAEIETDTKTAIFEFDIDEGQALSPTVDLNIEAGLQTQIDSWSLEKGTDLGEGYVLDYSDLFTSAEDLTLTYTSNILTNGFIIENMEYGILGVQGIPLRSSQEDETKYTINLVATDAIGLSTTVELELPEIQETSTAPPTELHPLEGQKWYSIDFDYGSIDNSYAVDYDIVTWCASVRVEDGVVYESYGSDDNASCSEVDKIVPLATYIFDDDDLIITYSYIEQGRKKTSTLTFKMKGSADEISKGAQTVTAEWDENTGQALPPIRYTFFKNKDDIEKRLNIKSDMDRSERTFNMYLPADDNGKYNLGTAKISLLDLDEDDLGAKVTFEAIGNDITCETLDQFYSGFYFGNEDVTIKSQPLNDWNLDFDCANVIDDELNYAEINFTLPTLEIGDVYTIFGDSELEELESLEMVKFNIKWTGVGSKD